MSVQNQLRQLISTMRRQDLSTVVDEFINASLMASSSNVAWFTATGLFNISGTDDNAAARTTTAASDIIYNIANVTKVRLVWHWNNPGSFPAQPSVMKYESGWSTALTPSVFSPPFTEFSSWTRYHWEFTGLNSATQLKISRPSTSGGAWTPLLSDITFYGGTVG